MFITHQTYLKHDWQPSKFHETSQYKNHGFHSVENLEPQVTTHFQGPLTSLVTWCLCCLYMLISKPSTQCSVFFHVRQCVCIGGCQFAPGSQWENNSIHFDEGHFTKPSLHLFTVTVFRTGPNLCICIHVFTYIYYIIV